MKKPSIKNIRGKVQEIAGAVEARVGHAIGSDKLESRGRAMQAGGETRRKRASPAEGSDVVDVVEVAQDETTQERAAFDQARANAPAEAVKPQVSKPNRAQRRHPAR